jgi:hypothetical protein
MEAYIEKNMQGPLGMVPLVHLAGRYILAECAADVVEGIPF